MQSFAGVAQVTIHGVAEGEERVHETIKREIAEELQEMLRESGERHDPDSIRNALGRHFPQQLHALARWDRGGERIITLGCLVDHVTAYEALQPLLRANQLKLVRRADLPRVRTVDPFDPSARVTPVPPEEIVMFPDEYEALQRVFDLPENEEEQ